MRAPSRLRTPIVRLSIVTTLVAVSGLFIALPGRAVGLGASWSLVPSPSMGTVTSSLADVAGTSDNDVWAVGLFFDSGRSINRTLIEHFNGSRWTVVRHPGAGTGYHSFAAVEAVGANDIWAVGSFSRVRFASEQSLIMRWNGTGWAMVTAPTRPGWDAIQDVSAVSATDAWAVGNGYTGSFITHWDGATWSLVPSPNLGWLQSVDALSSTDVWVVGQQTVSQGGPHEAIYGTLVLHWDGSSWTEVASPSSDKDFTFLQSVSARSTTDVWAVGAAWDSTQPTRTYIQRWDGLQWSIVPGAGVGTDSELFDVVSISSTEAWAVGTVAGQTLVEHWTGSAWEVDASPSPGDDDALLGIARLPSGDLWAVGTTHSGGAFKTLTMRRSAT